MADDNATYGNAGDNRQSTFGRSLMNYISYNLPYGKSTNVLDNIAELNPNYKDFLKVGDRKEQLLSQHAISTAKPGGDNSGVGQVALDKNYHAFMYANVDFDKSKRLRDYRVMAQFAEVADALDEICDECIVKDHKGSIVNLVIDPQQEYNTHISDQLQDEFRKFLKHYMLEEKGWEGVCVDLSDLSQEFKKERKTPFYQVDATGDEFIEILKKHFPKRFIHYISLDVDSASLDTLENLMRNNFHFGFMTFEHDIHWVMTYERNKNLGGENWLCEGRTKDQI